MLKRFLVLVIFLLSYTQAIGQSVDTAWVRRYNGPGNGTDQAYAIAVDGSGNVYVTGYSLGTGTSTDYATIKYHSNGDTAWVRRYNGPANLWDEAEAIGVDGSGNVYVTGSSRGIGLGNDYADLVTIKYDSSGNELWVSRYNGPSIDLPDGGTALVIDKFGNIYVTGYSYGSGTGYDFLTIKYYPNGDTAWLRTWNGPQEHDIAHHIALDNSGDVYVTGYSGSGISFVGWDYATVKYDPNGNEVWARIYNGPGDSIDYPQAIAADYSGNIYVAGVSWGGSTGGDYATIKYYPNGDTAWVRRYNGPGNSNDGGTDIAIDTSGNIYVTGSSIGIVGLDDYTTIKYYPNGDTAWVRRYNGNYDSPDYAQAIRVDSHGCIYVTGSSYGSWGGLDFATVKYDANGNELWVARYSPIGNCWAKDMAVDLSGNVYVTGVSYSSLTDDDYAIAKYVQFLRGDANKDGQVAIGDVIFLINYLFRGGPAPDPIQAGDANCDGKVTVADVVYLINYLFKGGPLPCK